ncbi:Na+/H+ antiporter subunit E [Rheinheimera texasensis]|uniref:Na+/H+ antiporter subunit E n=1 Tax=Rheinheimera texasensis TaxID=306205 RepID=UPI0032B2EDD9
MRKSLFATPLRSALLFVVWCALHNSLSPVVLLSGLILALLIPWLSRGFREAQPNIRRYGLFGRYLLMVLWDIVIANLQVVKVVLGRNSALKPGFVLLPLDVREPLPLTILAATICLTPGTVSAELLPRQAGDTPRYLLLHVLDLQDEEALIRELKQRYEAPLQEIFACSV